MQSFLIVAKNKKAGADYCLSVCKKENIEKIDIDIRYFEKMVGVNDVRELQKKLILKPFKSKTKAVILDGSCGLTIEAQNALLKILEEPPSSTIIYIIIPNKDLMLPTVLSRCKIVELKEKFYDPSEKEIAQYLNILISLFSKGVGERLKLAQDIAKNKDEAIIWLERMIIVTRQELINLICHSERSEESLEILRLKPQDDNLSASQYHNILISFQKTYTLLKTTNVSKRVVLENLFLNL